MSASNVYYLDTSVLVKLFLDEPDSEKVRKVRDEKSAQLVTSWSILLDTVKVLKRKRRSGKMDGKSYSAAIRDLFGMVVNGKLRLMDEEDENGNSVFTVWNQKIKELGARRPERAMDDIFFMAFVKSGFLKHGKK